MKKRVDRDNRILKRYCERITPIKAFSVASIASLLVLLMCFVATRGELINRYFWWDMRDTGMDFFHSMEYVRGRWPYEQYHTLYPPLANLFFLCLYFIVPVGISSNWASNFGESIVYRGNCWDLRTYQAPMLLFILVLAITAWMLITLVISLLKKYPYRQANTAAICILLSPGMLMAFERGNILFFVIPLCLFFIHYRNSENPIVRELALISLAVAAGLKLYPAFFGVLLIKDKKYARAARAVLYGVLSVVLPCFAFKEGLSAIPMWLSITVGFGAPGSMPHIGTGFANILHRVALYANDYLGISIPTDGFTICAALVSMLLLLASLCLKKDWESVLAITLSTIMFTSNGQYIYAMMCIPAVCLLMEEDRFYKSNVIPCTLVMLLCVHLPLFYTHGGSYPDVAIKQMLSLLIVIWCVYKGISNGIFIIKQKTFRRK